MKEVINFGYKDTRYHKNMHQQMVDVLKDKQAFGVSRKYLKANGLADDKISSVSTYKKHKKSGSAFVR